MAGGHLYKMEIYKDELLYRLCNEEEEIDFYMLFECAALGQGRFAMQSTLESLLEKDLANGFLNLIKGTNPSQSTTKSSI